MIVADFIERFEAYCPPSLAEEGDPIGLQIGDRNAVVKKILVTLDVRPQVVAEAIAAGVDLIFAKHPLIFRPAKTITTDNPQTKMYLDLIQHQIAVYVAHTNLDIVPNGLNDWFCEALEIQETDYLTPTHTKKFYKLQTFVPVSHTTILRDALANVGAGVLGAYQGCAFTSAGTGYFTPNVEAKPFSGTKNQPSAVPEEKLEVSFPEELLAMVVETVWQHHPYEEPVLDIFLDEGKRENYGLGRVGNLATPIPLADFIQRVKKTFAVPTVKVIANDPQQMVQRIAICGGSGEKFYPDAIRQHADVYITGDVYYHTAHDMEALGLTVIDPGHYIESFCKEKLVRLFNSWQLEKEEDLTIVASKVNTNPFSFQ